MLLKIRISLVLAMLGSFCLCPVLASGVSATVSGSSACVYRQPSDSSHCIRVRKGTKVTVKDVRGGWAKVSRKGLVGYIRVSALSRSKASKRASWKKKVVAMEWFNGGDGVMKEGHYGYVYPESVMFFDTKSSSKPMLQAFCHNKGLSRESPVG